MTSYLEKHFDLNSEDLIEVIDELPFWSAPFGIELLHNIKLKKNIQALDIGFGLGFPLTELAMRLGSTSKVFGIDPWETAIKRTENKIKAYGITNVELINGVSEDIPLPNNSIIRSIFCYKDKIYAGGYNEFGYFEKDAFGDLSYFSISDELNKIILTKKYIN